MIRQCYWNEPGNSDGQPRSAGLVCCEAGVASSSDEADGPGTGSLLLPCDGAASGAERALAVSLPPRDEDESPDVVFAPVANMPDEGAATATPQANDPTTRQAY
jgi:hypothetical protein